MSIADKYRKGYTEYQFEHGPFTGTILLSRNVENVKKIRKLFSVLLSRTIAQQIVKDRRLVAGMIQVNFLGHQETFSVVANDMEFVAVNVDNEEDCREMIEAIMTGNTDNTECSGIDQSVWRN